MQDFPYFEILKKSYRLTLANRWLWWFGLFIGGVTGSNAGLGSQVSYSINSVEEAGSVVDEIYFWIQNNSELFAALFAVVLVVFFLVLILQALSKAAVIWSADNLLQERKDVQVSFGNSLKFGKRYIWRIMGLQLMLVGLLFLLLALFVAPVVYLFASQSLAEGFILALLGLTVFVPALIVVGFLHLFGPIIIVLYSQSIKSSLSLSFQLIRKKWRECLVVSVILIGTHIGLLVVIFFGAVVLALAGAFLIWIASLAGAPTFASLVAILAVLAGLFCVIVLRAGFAVFHNIVWVLTVRNLIPAIRIEEPAEEMATEAAL